MEDERPQSADDEFSVRLRWPKVPEPTPDEADLALPPSPSAPPAPSVASAPSREGSGSAAPGGSRRRTVTVRTGAAAPAGAVRPPALPGAGVERPAPADPAPSTTPPPPVPPPPPSSRPPVAAPDLAALGGAAGAPAGTPEGAVARTFVDAFDRLSERLLERLRTIRQDVDTDLQAVRTELNQLRQSFEDASQSVQLRQLHASLEEVRGDVEGLRRAVLEWPELDRLSDDVAAMRGDLSLLFDPARDSGDHAPSAVLGELESTVERLAAGVGRIEEAGGARELSWLVDEVAAVRTDVHKLLKRVRPTVRLDPEQIDLIADAVAARLRDEPDAGGRRSRRK